MDNTLWKLASTDEIPLHMIEWIDLYKKALKLGFPHKSGRISKKELIRYIRTHESISS